MNKSHGSMFTFWKTGKRISKVLHVSHSRQQCLSFGSSKPSLTLGVVDILILTILCALVSHRSFNLYFSNDYFMLNIFSCVCYLYIYFGDMTFSTFYEFIFNYFCCCFVLFSYAEFENSLFILIQILYQICNFQIIFFQFATFFLTVYFKNFLIWMAFILSIFFFDVSCFGLISKKSLPNPKSKKNVCFALEILIFVFHLGLCSNF